MPNVGARTGGSTRWERWIRAALRAARTGALQVTVKGLGQLEAADRSVELRWAGLHRDLEDARRGVNHAAHPARTRAAPLDDPQVILSTEGGPRVTDKVGPTRGSLRRVRRKRVRDDPGGLLLRFGGGQPPMRLASAVPFLPMEEWPPRYHDYLGPVVVPPSSPAPPNTAPQLVVINVSRDNGLWSAVWQSGPEGLLGVFDDGTREAAIAWARATGCDRILIFSPELGDMVDLE